TTTAFERDLLSGLPPVILTERHIGIFAAEHNDTMKAALVSYLHMLRDAHIGQFQHMSDDVAVRAVSVPVSPAVLDHMTWKDSVGKGFGGESYVGFTVQEPQFVYAIRLTYSYENTGGRLASFRMSWAKGENYRLDKDTWQREQLLETQFEERPE